MRSMLRHKYILKRWTDLRPEPRMVRLQWPMQRASWKDKRPARLAFCL
jgi:uncharacterized protein YbdZ (MbtH family)